MKYYLKLMRVHHYIKNLLVFAALACSGQLFNFEKWMLALQNHLVKHLHYIMLSTETYIVLRMSSSVIARRCKAWGSLCVICNYQILRPD